jgi:PAS domain S-box-containing protein
VKEISTKTSAEILKLVRELSDQKYALDQAVIVGVTDQHGIITYVNQKFCEVSGYSEAELLGQDHRILKSGVHNSAYFSELWKTISSGKIWTGEICNRAKNGSFYWVSTTIIPFLQEDEKPYQYFSIRHEISKLKAAEQTIIDQQARLIAASKLSALGEVSAAITHEINNPLGVILGRCEMLRDMLDSGDVDPKELRKIAEMIEKTGRRIEKIVKSMRTFTHGSEEEESQLSKIDDIVQGALDLVTQRFKDHGIHFDYMPTVPNLKVYCRPTQLLQVLVNLLNNAHDAVLKLEEKWVRLEILNLDDSIEFRIQDSGEGIPIEVQKKLFTPFFTTKDIQYGTGLGLSISRRFAEKHGGSLTLCNECKNTCFMLKIPKTKS